MRGRLWEALRHYWSAAVFAAAAIVVVAVAAPARAALAGAGFALLGAAFTRGVDIATERVASRQRDRGDKRRDLDETRRLAYVAKLARQSENAHLIATLVNALAYHQSADDPEAVVRHIVTLVDGNDGNPAWEAESMRWLDEQIDRINREAGDAASDQDR